MSKWIAVLVAGALMLAGAMGAAAYTDAEYDDLVSYIEGIRDNPPNTAVRGNPVHVAKWNRVLAAIGAHGQGEPAWPEATIHANAAKWPDSPWKRPSDYLKWKAAQAQQTPPPKPEITVTGGSAVTEGGDAAFTVTADPAPAANLAVSVTVSASGDYGAATGTRTVTVPATGSISLTVSTTDDSTDEADGSVTATVNAGSGYTVSASQGAATVSVADNDAPPVPVVRVTGGGAVTEGGDAAFTVTAAPVPAANLAVSVTVSASGDYGAVTGARTVTVPPTGSATFTVATTDDSTDEADGSVTATVNAGSGYTVSASRGAATVSVADNDDPAPDWTDYQTVVDYLIGIRDNPPNTAVKGNPVHIAKWNGVLEAVGYDTGTGTFATDEAGIHANAAQWPDSPWVPPSTFLNWVEAQEQASQQGEDQDQPDLTIQGQQTRFSHDCPHGVTIREDDDGVYVVTYPENAGPGARINCNVQLPWVAVKSPDLTINVPDIDQANNLSHKVNPLFRVTFGTTNASFLLGPYNDNVHIGDREKTFTANGISWKFVVEEDDRMPFEHDCGNGVTVQENTAGVHVITYPEGTAGGKSCDISLAHTTADRLTQVTVPDVDLGFWYQTQADDASTISFTFGTEPGDRATAKTFNNNFYQGDTSKTFSIGGLNFRLDVTDDEELGFGVRTRTSIGYTNPLYEGGTLPIYLALLDILEPNAVVSADLDFGGTAVRGMDYTLSCRAIAGITCTNLTSGTPRITIDASTHTQTRTGEYTDYFLDVTLLDDGVADDGETLTIAADPPGRGSDQTWTIKDVDLTIPVTLEWTRSEFLVREDNGPSEPVIRMTPPAPVAIPISFTLGGNAVRSEYDPVSEACTGEPDDWDYCLKDGPDFVIPAGASTFTITLALHGDDIKEFDEKVTILADTSGFPPNVSFGNNSPLALQTILNDDSPTVPEHKTARQCIAQDADNDKVLWAVVTEGGDYYMTPPAVQFIGGGGSGAAATAVLGECSVPNQDPCTAGRKVDRILLTSRGSGYTTAPAVVLLDVGGTGVVHAIAEASIPGGRLCGSGGHQVLIERKTDDPFASVSEGTPLEYAVYLSPPPMGSDTVKVKYTLSGRTYGETITGTADIGKVGGTVTINPPDGVNDGELHVAWSVMGGSNYRIHKDSLRDTVYIVDDDSLGWYFIAESMKSSIYEGSPAKLFKLVFDVSHSKVPEYDFSNILDIDFDISGCALSSRPLTDDTSVAGESDEIPCYIHVLPHLDLRLVTPINLVHRVSGDEFQIRKWAPRTNPRFTVEFQVGNDADKLDETIRMNPTFVFNNSTGGVESSRHGANFPPAFTVIDDDTLDLPDEGGKDTIYILATSAPSTPNCCNLIEDHTPTGWSRDRLAPTATKNVYRSQRTLNYNSDGDFTAATGWGTPEKVLDKVPATITVGWTRSALNVNENNGPSQPVLALGGSVTEIMIDLPGTLYTGTPTVTISGGGGSGATATAMTSGGSVTAINVTKPGEGYTSEPTVTISGGGGSGATAEAVISTSSLDKDYLIPYRLEDGTAVHGVDYGLHFDGHTVQPKSGTIRLDAGLPVSRQTFDIFITDDDTYVGNKTFSAILENPPLGVKLGANSTVEITIVDNETPPVQEEPVTAMRFLGFTPETQAIDEGPDLSVTGRFLSPVDFTGFLTLLITNPPDTDKHGCMSDAGYTHITDPVTLPAGVATDVTLNLDENWVLFNGAVGDSTATRFPKDDPDCKVLGILQPYPRVVDENDVVTHPGYSVDADDAYVNHILTIRDLDWTTLRVGTRNLGTAMADNDLADVGADFFVRPYGRNGTHDTGLSLRNLKRGEVVEFPVRAYRATVEDGDHVKKTALPLDYYEIAIQAHATRPQTNASVQKLADGYAVKWGNNAAADEGNGPCTDSLGITMQKHVAVCVNFKSKIPSDDALWDEEFPHIAFDFSSGVDKFGNTNLNPGVRSESDVSYFPIRKGDASLSNATGHKKFEIRTVGATTVAEPDTGYAWIPFDLYAWDNVNGSFDEVVGLAFCVDTDQTTASYYHDYTIYQGSDYDLVSRFPQYARYISGYAWGNGQESCSRPLAIPENGYRMYVRVLADSHDEGTETIRIKAVQRDPKPGGATIADSDWVTFTITNDGLIPQAWLARFGRTVGEQYVDTITSRFSAARTPGVQGRLAGHELQLADDANGPWSALDDRDGEHDGVHGSESITLHEALLNSSFSWTSGADDSGADDHGSLSVWGSAARSDFEGSEDTLRLHGEVTTGMIGADYARGDWLVGFAAGHTSGDGGYSDVETADGGEIDTSMTSVVPYTRWQLSDAWSTWAMLGYGRGDMTLKRDGERMDAPIGWTMAAAGVRTDLYATQATRLSLVSDGLWARTSSDEAPGLAASRADVTRLRLGLEGSHAIVAGASTFAPRAEVGMRHDGGDAETGFGVELGAGLAWSAPARGLILDVSGRTLIAHEDGALEDRGYAASLAFDPDPASARGPSLSLRQDWGGRAAGGLDALFAPAPLEDRTASAPESRWTAEAAWGFPAFGGRWTSSPHAGLGLSAGARDYTLGWRWTPEGQDTPGLSFGLEATRRESDATQPEHTVGFEAVARW